MESRGNRRISRAIVASYVGVLVFASFVFVAAGKLFWQGLLYVALALVGTTLNHLLVPAGSTLTADRAADATAGQDWDRKLLGASFLASVATFVVAGLDARFGWTGELPTWVTVGGAVLMLAGQVLFAVAKRENAFFSSTVRVQTERGHRVCDTGPYRRVRHPGYVGMLASLLAFPLVTSSWWAFVPATFGAAILVVRTLWEDRFLRAELPGYAEYAARTRWRLVPGIL